jgi:hypothetical protein
MSFRNRLVLTLIWVLSLVAVARLAVAQGGQVGQINWPKKEVPLNHVPVEQPVVLSGNDIGFRVDRQGPNGPIGRLVVRINGEWVEPQPPLSK